MLRHSTGWDDRKAIHPQVDRAGVGALTDVALVVLSPAAPLSRLYTTGDAGVSGVNSASAVTDQAGSAADNGGTHLVMRPENPNERAEAVHAAEHELRGQAEVTLGGVAGTTHRAQAARAELPTPNPGAP